MKIDQIITEEDLMDSFNEAEAEIDAHGMPCFRKETTIQ